MVEEEETRDRRWLWIAGVIVLGGAGLLMVCTLSVIVAMGLSEGPAVGERPAVALIRVEGAIQGGDRPVGFSAVEGAFSNELVRDIRRAREDASVKAVVLRVNSPGGSVVASDEIYQELLKVDKPVVVSMGELAASGGYYIAAAADEIVANPATLTGSIGVIAMTPNVEGLLDKIGVEMIIIKSGAHKDTLSGYRDLSEEEQAHWQSIIDETYNGFVQVVADGREMKVGSVRDLADGRVYTGKQAQNLGLVDELGNLPQAIDRAAELAGIRGEPRIEEYRRPPSLWEALSGALDPNPQISLQELTTSNRRFTLQYLYVAP